MTEHGATRPPAAWVGFGAAFVLGAATWAAWLAWEAGYTYDADGGVHGPYSTLQVLLCGLTFVAVTALASLRWSPVAVAAGTTLGFWVLWTVRAAMSDGTGLFLVGSALLLVGLIAASALAATVGYPCRRFVRRNPAR